MKKKIYKSRTNQSAALIAFVAVAVPVLNHYGIDVQAILAASGVDMKEVMGALGVVGAAAIVYFRQAVTAAPVDEQDRVTPRPK